MMVASPANSPNTSVVAESASGGSEALLARGLSSERSGPQMPVLASLLSGERIVSHGGLLYGAR